MLDFYLLVYSSSCSVIMLPLCDTTKAACHFPTNLPHPYHRCQLGVRWLVEKKLVERDWEEMGWLVEKEKVG